MPAVGLGTRMQKHVIKWRFLPDIPIVTVWLQPSPNERHLASAVLLGSNKFVLLPRSPDEVGFLSDLDPAGHSALTATQVLPSYLSYL